MKHSLRFLPWWLLSATFFSACDSAPTQTSPPVATTPAPVTQPAAPPRQLPFTSPDSLHLLRTGHVGRLRLNMKEAAMLAVLPAQQLRKTTRQLEGIDYPVYELRDARYPQAPPLLLEMVGDEEEGFRLWRVQVTAPQYRTAFGLGVGSTLGEVRRQFRLSTVELADAGLVAVSDQARMSWLLDEDSLPDRAAMLRNPATVPDGTRIKGVLLFR